MKLWLLCSIFLSCFSINVRGFLMLRWRRLFLNDLECFHKESLRSMIGSWEYRSWRINDFVVFRFRWWWTFSYLASYTWLDIDLIIFQFRIIQYFRYFLVLTWREHHLSQWRWALLRVWPSWDKLFSWLIWIFHCRCFREWVLWNDNSYQNYFILWRFVPNSYRCKHGKNL